MAGERITLEDIRNVVFDAFEERSRIDAETHGEHHEFVERWIAREKIKAERWETIKTQVFGWGVLTIIGAIGTWAAGLLGWKIGG